ncbi:GNAT family N-acetyltransferase [Streptomyces zagrosensis]|uniref:RimJ/RimL family protein N-acetyltransferase n=1 Tax=Streptomyces zagrosensis TaxID=1042984 RepID=A0A7W9V1T6_9ACTN|nr:GNAT family protein [Streptomyces zagrosensis]MBB5939633.1 RimJ/RimL family protein N-acetyltransferase [Streptomyces zagrosensis]
MLEPVELEMYGLLLRPWEEEDLRAIQCGIADPEYLRWSAVNAPAASPNGARDFLHTRTEGWRRGDMTSFAITDLETFEVLGSVYAGTIDFAHRSGRVGYWVLPEARGRRVAARGLEAMTRWLFQDVGLHRLELGHAVGNDASCRVADRCAYRVEGIFRGAMFDLTETPRDIHIHARLATDLPPYRFGQTAVPSATAEPPAHTPAWAAAPDHPR